MVARNDGTPENNSPAQKTPIWWLPPHLIYPSKRQQPYNKTRNAATKGTNVLNVNPLCGVVMSTRFKCKRILSGRHVHFYLGVDGRGWSSWKTVTINFFNHPSLMKYQHLLLWSELDLRKSEEKSPAPKDFAKAVFPTPQFPSNRTEIRTAGLEVGTSCLANASLCPVALSLSNKSAMSLFPYFKAVMSALMLSEFLTSMLQPAAHKHLMEIN